MKKKEKNTIKKAIDYLSIYCTKTERFNTYKHISRAIVNPLKISFITEEKIKGIEENTDFIFSKIPTEKERKKYFTATSVNKFFRKLFLEDTEENKEKIKSVSEDISNFLRKDVETELFLEEDIKGFYSQENTKYEYASNGSCMNKCKIDFFDFYHKIYSHSVKIVGLKIGNQVIARGLFWYNKEKEEYFLDRIYTADYLNTGTNQARLQSELFLKIKKYFNLKNLNAYNKRHIFDYINSKHSASDKVNIFSEFSKPDFSIKINSTDFYNFDNYPYLDTFRYGYQKNVVRKVLKENCKIKMIDKTFSILCFSNSDDMQEIILESTEGYFTEGGNLCECCEERIEEDYIHYSECEEEYLCDDCSTYIEERQDVCRQNNAIFNNYTQEYIYRHDIE